MIYFNKVGLRYGLGSEVLRDISFHITAGSFHFLTGASGAGKTTLLRLMSQILQPTRGLITLFDQETSSASSEILAALRRRIGIIFQDFRLLDHMTVYENVSLPLKIIGKMESSYKAEVKELLQWVGLGNYLNSYPPVLSGGEKQRVAIARALINQPEILLADEPTGNVDPDLSERLLSLFLELNRLGTAIVFATHDQYLLQKISARTMVLSGGRLKIYE